MLLDLGIHTTVCLKIGNTHTSVFCQSGMIPQSMGDWDPQVYAAITRATSYFKSGSQFNQSYKDGHWDGRVHLSLKPRSGKPFAFPTGLFGHVYTALESIPGVRVTIQDDRIIPEAAIEPLDKLCGIESMHAHQNRMVSGVLRKSADGDCIYTLPKEEADYLYNKIGIYTPVRMYGRGIWRCATGGGKTEAIAKLIGELGVSTLFVVYGNDLVFQTFERFKKRFGPWFEENGKTMGIAMEGNFTPGFVTVAGISTLNAILLKPDSTIKSMKKTIDVLLKEFFESNLVDGALILRRYLRHLKDLSKASDLISMAHELYSKSLVSEKEADLFKTYPQRLADAYAGKKDLEHYLSNINFLVYDEAHGAGSDMGSRICLLCDAYFRVGMSVGPDTMVMIKNQWEEVFHITIREAEEMLRGDVACYHPGEFFLTGGWKVRSFKDGKFVWSNLLSVLVHRPDGKKCFEITTSYGRKIIVTEDHSVFIVKPEGEKSWKQNKARYKPIIECVEGSNVKVGDYLLLENNVDCGVLEEVDLFELCNNVGEYNFHKDELQCLGKDRRDLGIWHVRHLTSEEFGFILGFYLGDGWLGERRVTFAVERGLVDILLEKIKPLLTKLNINYKIRDMPRGSIELRLNSRVLRDSIDGCGASGNSHTKRLPSIAWDFDESGVLALIEGLVWSDGHETKSLKRGRKRIYYTTVSEGLAADVAELLKRVGIVSSIQRYAPKPGGWVDGKQIVSNRVRYVVHWSPLQKDGHKGSGRIPAIFDMDGVAGLPVKVRSIEEVDPPEFVYDFSVEDSHNFLANGLLVHNSGTPLSRSDSANLPVIGSFGDVLVRVSNKELHDAGITPPAEIVITLIEGSIEKCSFPEAVTKGIVEYKIRNEWIQFIVENRVRAGKKVLVLFERANHGEILSDLLEEIDLGDREFSHIWLDGESKTKERQKAVKDFSTGDTDVLVASKIFRQGIDLPVIDVLVMAGGGKGTIVVLQSLGRGLRGNDLEVYDFADTHDKRLARHSKKRVEIYEAQGCYDMHPVKSREDLLAVIEKIERKRENE